jgi:hypothetical protein
MPMTSRSVAHKVSYAFPSTCPGALRLQQLQLQLLHSGVFELMGNFGKQKLRCLYVFLLQTSMQGVGYRSLDTENLHILLIQLLHSYCQKIA